MSAPSIESSDATPSAHGRVQGQQFDDVDRALLTLLSRTGRASYTELADRVRLSVSAVHQRVRRLEQRGVVKGYHADVDATALGLPLLAFVSISAIDPEVADDIPPQLACIEGIEACHSVTGAESFLLQVRVASPNALEELLATIRQTAHVTTRTKVVMSTYFTKRGPL